MAYYVLVAGRHATIVHDPGLCRKNGLPCNAPAKEAYTKDNTMVDMNFSLDDLQHYFTATHPKHDPIVTKEFVNDTPGGVGNTIVGGMRRRVVFNFD